MFTDSAGALLVALATGMFICNVAGAGWVESRDPLFRIPTPVVFWILGVLELAVGLVCLFGKQNWLKRFLTLWFSITFLTFQFGFFWIVGLRSCYVYWNNVAVAFHVTPGMAPWILIAVCVYLLVGSGFSLLWPLLHKARNNTGIT